MVMVFMIMGPPSDDDDVDSQAHKMLISGYCRQAREILWEPLCRKGILAVDGEMVAHGEVLSPIPWQSQG